MKKKQKRLEKRLTLKMINMLSFKEKEKMQRDCAQTSTREKTKKKVYKSLDKRAWILANAKAAYDAVKSTAKA